MEVNLRERQRDQQPLRAGPAAAIDHGELDSAFRWIDNQSIEGADLPALSP